MRADRSDEPVCLDGTVPRPDLSSEQRMNSILEKFARVARQPYEHVAAWKQTSGQRVVGTFAMHCPAELIHAAGALPVVL